MRRGLFILVFMLAPVWLAGATLAAPKILSRDGSLVIDHSDAKPVKKIPGSEDTLYELLGQEVQVYIFNKKSRIWPRVEASPGGYVFKGRVSPGDPRVEGLIQKYAQKYGVDPALVQAVMRHESGFNPTAVSPKGAQGLMQLMPGTAALMGVKDPFDPEQNIAGGVGYLRRCLDRFQHNVPLAVAAYNAGPESVAKCGAIPPYQETQAFVTNVMGNYAGPSQGGKAMKGSSKAAAKTSPKGVKQEDPDAATASDLPRRPRPKIIEVKSYKIQSKAVAPE